MVLFLTLVLLLSCIAMALLLYVKHWELSTGKVLLADARPRIGNFFHRGLVFVERHIPALMRDYWRRLLSLAWRGARAAVARALLWLEHVLETILETLRHNLTPPQEAGGQASAFLREVSDYKKKLTKRPRARRVADVKPVALERTP